MSGAPSALASVPLPPPPPPPPPTAAAAALSAVMLTSRVGEQLVGVPGSAARAAYESHVRSDAAAALGLASSRLSLSMADAPVAVDADAAAAAAPSATVPRVSGEEALGELSINALVAQCALRGLGTSVTSKAKLIARIKAGDAKELGLDEDALATALRGAVSDGSPQIFAPLKLEFRLPLKTYQKIL